MSGVSRARLFKVGVYSRYADCPPLREGAVTAVREAVRAAVDRAQQAGARPTHSASCYASCCCGELVLLCSLSGDLRSDTHIAAPELLLLDVERRIVQLLRDLGASASVACEWVPNCL